MDKDVCKICGEPSLDLFAHTARCSSCDVLLFFPYPEDDAELMLRDHGKSRWTRESVLQWYTSYSYYNHENFTRMAKFALNDPGDKDRALKVLDYGGGGGQFAPVCKSLFPLTDIHFTDISDESLLDEWASLVTPIRFADFPRDDTRFDVIFLNDVFEHVSDPVGVLSLLAGKLEAGGRIFIDTPKQFWIYPVTRAVSPALHTKVLKGTVTAAHLQIWSKKAFDLTVDRSGLVVERYEEISEYTMPPESYLDGMGISNPLIRLAGRLFYANAGWLARNKIVCVLRKKAA